MGWDRCCASQCSAEANVARFRNRLRGLRDRWRADTVTRAEVEAKVGAWIAHAENADTWRLRRAVFGGGWFGMGGGGEGSVRRHHESVIARLDRAIK